MLYIGNHISRCHINHIFYNRATSTNAVTYFEHSYINHYTKYSRICSAKSYENLLVVTSIGLMWSVKFSTGYTIVSVAIIDDNGVWWISALWYGSYSCECGCTCVCVCICVRVCIHVCVCVHVCVHVMSLCDSKPFHRPKRLWSLKLLYLCVCYIWEFTNILHVHQLSLQRAMTCISTPSHTIWLPYPP